MLGDLRDNENIIAGENNNISVVDSAKRSTKVSIRGYFTSSSNSSTTFGSGLGLLITFGSVRIRGSKSMLIFVAMPSRIFRMPSIDYRNSVKKMWSVPSTK